MSSNTQIFIKRSEANNTPGNLHTGELAYSYSSNTLFIGANTATGPGYYKIGGEYYTNIIDSATSANTPDTLVLRDGDGSFSANVVGADSIIVGNGVGGNIAGANTVYASYFFGDGSGLTNIPSALNITGDSGSNTVHLRDETLLFAGGEGLTSVVSGDTVTFDVDDTVIRANTEMPGTSQHIQTSLQISGDLIVQGNTTYVNTAIYATTDSLIELAANNTTGDVIDIGFYGLHGNTTTEGVDITGLVRNAGTSDYYLFDRVNIGDETDINANTLAQAFTSANGASLYAHQFLAAQGDGSVGGFSFSGNEDGLDTGMFSPTDGQLEFYTNSDRAGQVGASNEGTSFGVRSAATNQGYKATAIGLEAGQTDQGDFAVAVGLHAGQTSQGSGTVAVGHSAGQTTQQQDATAIGNHAGQNNQGYKSTALGYRAGYGDTTGQGEYSVALGALAGYASQSNNSIAINASGNNLNPTEAGLYIDPIRANNAIGGNVTTYNTTTKELVSTDVKINNSGITLANGTVISDGEAGFFVDSLNFGETGNIAFYNVATHEITFGPIGDVIPTGNLISNGTHTWAVSADTGALYSDLGTTLACSANSVLIGNSVDFTNSNYGRVAIGEYAGASGQGNSSTAVGNGAGNNDQYYFATAVGYNAGYSTQGTNSVAVGHAAAQSNQGGSSVAVGFAAGNDHQGTQSVAMGRRAGRTYQGDYSTAIGPYAGQDHQGGYAVAMGYQAGQTYQRSGAIAIGDNAGQVYQKGDSIAVGTYAGQNSANTNGWAPIAIGRYAGREGAGSQSVAIGNNAGNNNLGYHAIALGYYAASSGSGIDSVSIGSNAGQSSGNNTISIGVSSGAYSNDYSVALGYESGYGYNNSHDGTSGLGEYQVAIGYRAAWGHGYNNSIVLNASGSDLSANASGLYVNPIRYTEEQDADYDGLMFYNSNTNEVRYSYALDGGSF